MGRLAALQQELTSSKTATYTGKITAIKGSIVYAELPQIGLGDLCTIQLRAGRTVRAEAIGFQGKQVTLAPHDSINGISPGSIVTHQGQAAETTFPYGAGMILDAEGAILDEGRESSQWISKESRAPSPHPLTRAPIDTQLQTGIASIDLFTPIGVGQRLGLFAGPGLGKSTLLGMIARNADVDICVIALVGERGREVGEFVQDTLGEQGRRRSVVVASTSDESPLRRKLALETATGIAEYYREQGKRVLLLVDSITRVARAIRDVSLTAGEFPVRHGYTASVFSELPRFIERTGNNSVGSITALYTVLTSGPEELDPLAEELKGLLDGHIVLNKKTMEKGILPAIDVTTSLSRLAQRLSTDEMNEVIPLAKKLITRIYNDKELLLLGGEADEELAWALSLEQELLKILTQRPEEERDSTQSLKEITSMLNKKAEEINESD